MFPPSSCTSSEIISTTTTKKYFQPSNLFQAMHFLGRYFAIFPNTIFFSKWCFLNIFFKEEICFKLYTFEQLKQKKGYEENFKLIENIFVEAGFQTKFSWSERNIFDI